MSGEWRLFVAVSLEALAAGPLEAIRTEWGSRLPGLRWVERSNLHLTLRFLGETARERVEPLVRRLERVERPAAGAPVRLAGGGAFPQPARARVIWLGVEAEWLAPLARAVEAAIREAGWPAEERPFQPHLTVARARRGESVDAAGLLEGWQGRLWAAGSVSEFALYRSQLRPAGPLYTVVARFPFR
ncbi:MAG: RNA 2',3'-cyclic phosphodiesterase [Bacillota bacterium]|nr:RNA 2',3'-cyclic phosphodiesterase [Bacillota bacterium]